MTVTDSTASRVRNERMRRRRLLKRCTLYKLAVLTVIFAGLFVGVGMFVPAVFSINPEYELYFYLAVLGVAGFFIIRTVSQLVYGLIIDASESQARAARGLIVITGYLAVVAIAVSMLAKSPTVTVVIGTVTGIMLGISLQNLIGNAMAGMVLAIMRPFRIGDRITVFDKTGNVYDIGLLYTIVAAEEGKTILVPNTSLLTTAIIKEKRARLQGEAA